MNNKKRRREKPAVRKKEILNAAISLAMDIGYQNITREAIALSAKASTGLVTLYFSTMQDLKNAVMKTAIEKEILLIIAQGLSIGDEQAQGINADLKKRVSAYLSN